MLWIRRLLPCREMTAGIPAIGRGDLKIVVSADMAARAGHVSMPVGQRETDGRGSVIETRSVERSPQPSIECVASLAGLRELGCDVVWHTPTHGLRAVPIGLMTRYASRREPLKLSDRCALMTVLALQGSMRAEQRKPILVVFYLLHRDIPALDRVALRAIRAHFSLVHVGVAVFAIFPHVRENGLYVALRAFHLFMHAAQGILGFVVVELRVGPNGTPCGGGMTVFARDCQRAVRTSSGLPLGGLRWSVCWVPREKQ